MLGKSNCRTIAERLERGELSHNIARHEPRLALADQVEHDGLIGHAVSDGERERVRASPARCIAKSLVADVRLRRT
jgi:hypothetical protein